MHSRSGRRQRQGETEGALGSYTCVPTCTKFCVPFTVLLLKDAASSCCLPALSSLRVALCEGQLPLLCWTAAAS